MIMRLFARIIGQGLKLEKKFPPQISLPEIQIQNSRETHSRVALLC